jgi:hypothetical protein
VDALANQDGTTLLIILVVAAVGGYLLIKLMVGVVKMVAMVAAILFCLAMFVPGLRAPLLAQLKHASTTAVQMQDSACKKKGMTPAQCDRVRQQLIAKINTDCFGSTHSWPRCRAHMKDAGSWVNMLCMARSTVTEDCVNAARDRLREQIKKSKKAQTAEAKPEKAEAPPARTEPAAEKTGNGKGSDSSRTKSKKTKKTK